MIPPPRNLYPSTGLLRAPSFPSATRLPLLLSVLAASAPAAAEPRDFSCVQLLEPKGETSADVSLGEFDGDGWPDIAAARSDAPNAIWFNTPAPKK